MYAIIASGGKQHRVTKGEILKVEKIAADVGATVEFDKVLMLADANAGAIRVGNPYLDKTKVLGEVIEHGRGEKISILKFRRRKHHLKRQGHRQGYTAVKISDIVSGVAA